MVIDNLARLDTNVWGYLLTPQRLSGAWRALCVIDGICRDVDRSFELNYPSFSQGNWVRTSKDQVRIGAV
ncbi:MULTISPECIES: hypothetical protein [Pseudomonas]|uniref:RraA family protein n=1 Tax=Pseudomonas TaxID=286 RepID=UPI001E0E54AB|nr:MULTISPECIES: hypothetical protein [Pseudomonas]CAH0143715.1 hypothetical protein SRABI08_00529 [Pseudomonas carnis]CAH0153773.1 hypothetical protein SRABI111_00772 [Pseudomonas carnis]CAH0213509.1 hypothetical protein SRABI64_02039 [Pseudomonas carnis]CAH0226500.1 hypothetical protein SRABI110_02620 [Pseudomonas carnis]